MSLTLGEASTAHTEKMLKQVKYWGFNKLTEDTKILFSVLLQGDPKKKQNYMLFCRRSDPFSSLKPDLDAVTLCLRAETTTCRHGMSSVMLQFHTH